MYITPKLTDKEIVEYLTKHCKSISFGNSTFSPSYLIESKDDLIDAIEQHKIDHH